MMVVKLFSREGCHLCEEAYEQLKALQPVLPHEIEVIDIEKDEQLLQHYALIIPVIQVGPYELKAPFTLQELQVTLGAAYDRMTHLERIERSPNLQAIQQSVKWTWSDKFSEWISHHYMMFFNLLVAVYLGLPFLAPVFMKLGYELPAAMIYRGYSLVCHQLSFRSFFLFGEQIVYPREAAGLEGLRSFEEATGLSEQANGSALEAARKYIGEEGIGYKVALCERDIAIYTGILIFGIIFSLTGKKIMHLPWYWWTLIGILPIGLDGLSQLLSQPPFNFWAFRESTPMMRILTGGLFGLATAWFGYPMVEETMLETRSILAEKKRRCLHLVRE